MSEREVKCKSCRAPILYRYTPGGKLMPLDPERLAIAEVGLYRVVDEQNCNPAEPMFDPPGTMYHRCHFDTCPMAEPFRRP